MTLSPQPNQFDDTSRNIDDTSNMLDNTVTDSSYLGITACNYTSTRWVVLEFCTQEGAASCEIPASKWSNQGGASIVSHFWKKPLNFIFLIFKPLIFEN